MCMNCLDFGFACNYNPEVPDLHLRTSGAACIDARPANPVSTNETILAMINGSQSRDQISAPEDLDMLQLDLQDLERLVRFQTRTVFSIGTSNGVHVYQNQVTKLANTHPFLMHVIQAATAIHDRYLSGSAGAKPSAAEIYHYGQAAALLNKKLSAPIRPGDRDALWATAALLGVIALSSIDATTPEEAWPLKPASPSDLDWLRMSQGKKAIWKIANPFREDSVFHPMSNGFHQTNMFAMEPLPGQGIMLSALADLCNLHDSPIPESNPYYRAVHSLVPLLDMQFDESTIVRFLSFISHFTPEFHALLLQKDPRALLLLAYWYAKVGKTQWWIAYRAHIECQAICIYLDRYHADNTALQKLLHFPKMRCGLIV